MLQDKPAARKPEKIIGSDDDRPGLRRYNSRIPGTLKEGVCL